MSLVFLSKNDNSQFVEKYSKKTIQHIFMSAKKTILMHCYHIDMHVANIIVNYINRGISVKLLFDSSLKHQNRDHIYHMIDYIKYIYSKINDKSKFSYMLSPSRFCYSHQKYIIIDNKIACISTGNFDKHVYGDLVYYTNNKDIINSLITIFNCDWKNIEINSDLISPDLLYSDGCCFIPLEVDNVTKTDSISIKTVNGINNSNKYIDNIVKLNFSFDIDQSIFPDGNFLLTLYNIISNSKESIYITAFEWDDKFGLLNSILLQKAKEGVNITIVFGDVAKDQIGKFLKIFTLFNNNNIKLYFSGAKLHAKLAVVDNNCAILGSANSNVVSHFFNREIGVLIHDKKCIDECLKFIKDSIDHKKTILFGNVEGDIILSKKYTFNSLKAFKRSI